jgi:ATP synthase protein I
VKDSIFYTVGLYGATGLQLAISVVAGLAFGNYIDKYIGSSPWLAIIGTIIGTVAGLFNLVKMLKINEKKDQGIDA